ncbi:PQQ-dependent sugar dehydrogenase, partial [Candidatus Parcubacteria bacterium]|nr:PQQ-dependent sugar dehydrogenase [Candidatus Parcubacteria bacterium]
MKSPFLAAVASALFLVPLFSYAAPVTPAGFQIETVAGGFNLPTQMAFAANGDIYVAEKGGAVRAVKNGVLDPTPVITLSDVNTFADRGLLGLALDPNFASNGFMYLLYTYENTPGQNFTGPKTARLVRVTVSGGRASEASKSVLLGNVGGDAAKPSCNNFAVTADCIASDSETHSGGGLMFGPDGKLYATLGDGAEFKFADQNALRALNIDSLAGKIVRINADGTAPADNPFYNGNSQANRSKVWSYGLRNSFRFNFRPSTGKLYFGDVGWATWEEVNIAARGGNFGWPCREGFAATSYNCTTPNYIDPLYAYDHSSGTGSVVGGTFPGAAAYGAGYANSYFVGDYSQDVIRRLAMDANDNLVSAETFVTGAGGPVDMKTGPDGNIYYLSIYTGELRRMVASTGNRAPSAVPSATPTSATAAPLTVNFSSAGSSDPDGDPLSFAWTFGDGGTSTSPNPQYTYTQNGVYAATLTVSDGKGKTGSAQVTIRIGAASAVAPHHVKTAADPSPAFIGRNVLITSTVTNAGNSGPVNVDFEIFNAGGTRVAQKVYENEQIAAGASRDFTFDWFPPTVGTYRVSLGLFENNWAIP